MKIARIFAPAFTPIPLIVLLSAPSLAGEPKVRVTAEVILASNNGNAIDPPALVKIKNQFSEKGIAFTSYRRISLEKLSLRKKPVEIKLPNRRTATLRLDEMKAGIATVRVDISQLTSTILTMGREGSLFQHAGEHEGGQLFLRLSPDETAQPRRIAGSATRYPAELNRGGGQDPLSLTPVQP